MALSPLQANVSNDGLRMAIDIGGTFTDAVLVDSRDTIVASTKTLTSHKNPADAATVGA